MRPANNHLLRFLALCFATGASLSSTLAAELNPLSWPLTGSGLSTEQWAASRAWKTPARVWDGVGSVS